MIPEATDAFEKGLMNFQPLVSLFETKVLDFETPRQNTGKPQNALKNSNYYHVVTQTAPQKLNRDWFAKKL